MIRKIEVRIDVNKGRGDEVPVTLPDRIEIILSAAFAELVDEGVIDIVVASHH